MSVDDLIRERLETLVEPLDDPDAVMAAIERRTPSTRRRSGWPMLAAAAVVVAVAAVGGTIWLGGEPNRAVVAGPGTETTDGAETTVDPDATDRAQTTTTVPSLPAVPRSSLGIADSSACPEPWSPISAKVTGGPTEGSSPPVDERLDLLGRTPEAPDTDGDGRPDRVSSTGEGLIHDKLAVTRAHGDLVFGRAGGVVLAPGGHPWIGDLDGDGLDELLLYVGEEDPDVPPFLVVVPGSLPDGPYDPVQVGAILPVSANSIVSAVGDLDGDGGDDLALQLDSGRAVVSGVAVLAGRGTREVTDPVPIAAGQQRFHDPLWLGDAAPVFSDVTEDHREVVLHTDPPVRLGFTGVEPPLPGHHVRVGAFRSGGDRIVMAEQAIVRGPVATWYWNLDDPCTGSRG
jgi:hypothetical protein